MGKEILSAFDDYENAPPAKCLAEKAIDEIASSIRAKPEWWKKIENVDILNKWRLECVNKNINGHTLTDNNFDFVLEELKFHASLSDDNIRLSPVLGAWESDTLINKDMKNKLCDYVTNWENNLVKKDFHPNTNNQILDLIHPSLCPVVYGLTRIVDDKNDVKKYNSVKEQFDDSFNLKTKILENSTEKMWGFCWSKSFQWLPCDVEVDKNKNAKILSYINNLDPNEHEELYNIIQNIITSSLPIFEKCLTNAFSPWPNAFDEDAVLERKFPEHYEIPKMEQVNFNGQKLQLMVKIANMILAPDTPEYPGGVWHVEGMRNENIVATFIYYFDSKNIGESLLEFRKSVSDPVYEQSDEDFCEEMYGLHDEDIIVDHMGAINCTHGKCISFPNYLQHRVMPFELEDKTKCGQKNFGIFFSSP
eukprot:GHVL01021391.1.p1 GENE.GHVL01021391.1~~GHVL01021391.1.p1  ORF type:complete len:420 (+),score=102.86 GHVL01021391.1:92-1351(+)